ncbi:endospore germination permease [Wukongibacter baidiensis]|uniref:GerAB/ArcD/ProY family transporter n=1 Tax=Wukongibacter baidiensis TaxID=1723361 RepID=UPI003D8000BB
MNKDSISNIQAVSILILFMSSTSTVLMVALSAQGDFWLAIILSVLMASVMAIIFAQLYDIYPEKNFYDMCESCFGKVLGGFICISYILFAFDEGALTLVNAKQFITETTLEETPRIITILPLVFLCAWAVKAGIGVIGKWSKLVIIAFISFVFIVVILLIPKMDANNLEPILYNGARPLYEGTISAFSFPFGEIVFLSLVFNFKDRKSAYRVYLGGLLISGVLALVIASTTVLILGVDFATTSYFPVHTAARVINIGHFIQRLEVIAVLISAGGAFLKVSILILAVCKGIAKLINFSDYRFIAVPVSLLMINFVDFFFDNRMTFLNYNSEIWVKYAIVFEIFIPVMVLFIAYIKRKRKRKIKA